LSKTLIGRFASPEDAGEAIYALRAYRPVGARPPARPAALLGSRVSAAVSVCMLGGAVLGYLSASGTFAGVGFGGGATATPTALLGATVLGLALGIPAGLVLGLLIAMLVPVRGAPLFRVQRVSRHGGTIVVQTTNRWAALLADRLRDVHAVKVHTLAGKVDAAQVGSALDQLQAHR
jgi:hypothetical protein